MVKDVINLDTQYWLLLDIPKQEKQEQVTTYVLRTCTCLEKAGESRTVDCQKPKNTQEEEAIAKERKARLDGEFTIKQLFFMKPLKSNSASWITIYKAKKTYFFFTEN